MNKKFKIAKAEKLYFYRSPAALGGTRSRPVMRLDVSESHRKTIEKYKDDTTSTIARIIGKHCNRESPNNVKKEEK